MRKRSIVRELLVYTFFSVKRLLLNGNVRGFVKDMMRFFYWHKTRLTSASMLQMPVPWMAFDAVDYLKGWLQKDMKVYEYGSGSSTLFFAERVQSIISVEHEEEWYKNGEAFRKTNHIKNIEYRFIAPQPQKNEAGACRDPQSYISCMNEYRGSNFEDYVKSIEEFPDEYFDLIVIDGRSRPSCIMHAMNKVKENGILLVDNSDRNYYLDPFTELFDTNKWQAQTYTGHVPYNPPSVLETTTLFTKKAQTAA